MLRRKTITFLCIIALAVFSISAWKLVDYYMDGFRSQNRYEELAAHVTTSPAVATETAPKSEYLPEYQVLSQHNPHMVGWIRLDGTAVDYPVVQTPDDPEYYLKRDFDGNRNERGCIFADAACDVERSDNVTIYGHNMGDGSMFAALRDYTEKDFWEDHATLRFDTLKQHRTYEIFAVFRTTASVGKGFAYHKFVDAAEEADFDAFIAECKALSLYETGITPEYGDQIVCLSTCEYTRENGRLVVAAVLQK